MKENPRASCTSILSADASVGAPVLVDVVIVVERLVVVVVVAVLVVVVACLRCHHCSCRCNAGCLIRCSNAPGTVAGAVALCGWLCVHQCGTRGCRMQPAAGHVFPVRKRCTNIFSKFQTVHRPRFLGGRFRSPFSLVDTIHNQNPAN